MKGLSVPGLGRFWDDLKKWGKRLVTALGGYIGGPIGAAVAVTVWNILEDALDKGGFRGGWGYGGYGGGLFGALGNPVQNKPVDQNVTVSYSVQTYFKKFETWFVWKSSGLKGSESKTTLLSDTYRKNVNDLLKLLESYRIYLQVKKNAAAASGLNSPIDVADVFSARRYKDKEDLVNAFKKAVWDAYIDALKDHGITARAKKVNFVAPKSDQGNFPEPFTWDKSKNYTSELLVFTSLSEGEPAEHLYEETLPDVIGVFDPNDGIITDINDRLEKVKDASNQFEASKPNNDNNNNNGNTNPTPTTQNPTENNQTGSPKTETENNKIFGLPKPLAYLIGGATLWKVLSN